jgi:MFS family permease
MSWSSFPITVSSSTAGYAYHELGLASVVEAGLDAWLIIIARSCRMFAYGANSTFIALFFSSLGFSDFRIGLFMTLTLAGDVILTLILTAVADSIGRRRTLFLGSCMMVCSGIVFTTTEHYWLLLLAAIIGVISPSGGDFGPFRAIEESILSQLTTAKGRSNVLSWYVTSASFGSAIGSEIAGHIVQTTVTTQEAGSEKIGKRWTQVDAYHACFGLYILFGAINMGCSALLSKRVELDGVPDPKEDGQGAELALLDDVDGVGSGDSSMPDRGATTRTGLAAVAETPKSGFARISPQTRSIMFKLWPLLIVDSLADGMASLSLTSYYLDRKFHVSASTLGHITSVSYFLAAFSTIFAGPLANHIGLVNTMVFTHVPSSAAVLLFPLPPQLAWTVVLFFIRTGLNNMDQAPRAAFIAAVVSPAERTAVNGITSLLRTLASTVGPTFTGGLAEQGRFWIAFVLAGTLRLVYDFGLWALFVKMPLDTT